MYGAALLSPLVTDGEPNLALPAYGWIYFFHAVTEASTVMWACSPRSGSLKPKMCLDPAARAFSTLAVQLLVLSG